MFAILAILLVTACGLVLFALHATGSFINIALVLTVTLFFVIRVTRLYQSRLCQ